MTDKILKTALPGKGILMWAKVQVWFSPKEGRCDYGIMGISQLGSLRGTGGKGLGWQRPFLVLRCI